MNELQLNIQQNKSKIDALEYKKIDLLDIKKVKKILKRLDSESLLKFYRLINEPSDIIFLDVEKMNYIIKMRRKRPPRKTTVIRKYHGREYKRTELT